MPSESRICDPASARKLHAGPAHRASDCRVSGCFTALSMNANLIVLMFRDVALICQYFELLRMYKHLTGRSAMMEDCIYWRGRTPYQEHIFFIQFLY